MTQIYKVSKSEDNDCTFFYQYYSYYHVTLISLFDILPECGVDRGINRLEVYYWYWRANHLKIRNRDCIGVSRKGVLQYCNNRYPLIVPQSCSYETSLWGVTWILQIKKTQSSSLFLLYLVYVCVCIGSDENKRGIIKHTTTYTPKPSNSIHSPLFTIWNTSFI